MEVCPRCGKPGHDERACTARMAPREVRGTTASLSPSSTGARGVAQNPVPRELRMLKTQLNLAVGLREEDPERAWLELVSLRERLPDVEDGAKGDALLMADVERFKGRLEEQIAKLTRDVGDEVVAPLYSWVDLLRQRARLEADVVAASARVAEARASRGAAPVPAPSTEEEAKMALGVAETELAWWRGESPPPPSPQARTVWLESGGDALRPSLPLDPQTVLRRGRAAAAVLARVRRRAPGAVPYVGSKAELLLLPTFGAATLLMSIFALVSTRARGPLGVLSAVGWLAFAVIIAVSVMARQRADAERRAAVDATWHHTLFEEEAAALNLEIGWLRALTAALRVRQAFDAHQAEGGQLGELARWRPDLAAVVAEVAKSNLVAPT